MEAIRSIYEDDPDMMEIVREFADELPDRAHSIERLWEAGDRPNLQTIAHQLKGAGGGYGFPSITERAAELEAALKSGADDLEVLDRLRSLCEILRSVQVSEGS